MKYNTLNYFILDCSTYVDNNLQETKLTFYRKKQGELKKF